MKNLLYVAILFGIYESGDGMNLEQSFDIAMKDTPIQWQTIIERTEEAVKHPMLHAIDVESIYGGGETYDPKIVCEQALNGDSIAQYSLYRHMKNNTFVAYMLLAISAIFGKFIDSREEARSLGLELKENENLPSLQQKIANLTGQYE